MPDIPSDPTLGFIAVIFLLLGGFLVLAGIGIIDVDRIRVTKGTRTWVAGILLVLLGAGLFLGDILVGAMAQSTSLAPLTASPANTTMVPTVPINTHTPSVTPAPPTDTPTGTPTLTATPSSTPTETVTPTPTPSCILEDFEATRQILWFSPDAGVFSYRETSEQAHSGNRSFKVNYNKTGDFQFLGAELSPGSCDFTIGRTVHIWVYGEVTLLLKLEDLDSNQVDISDQRASSPSGWTLLIYNYSGAENVIDLGRIKTMLLFPAPGSASESGEFFIDDVAVFP